MATDPQAVSPSGVIARQDRLQGWSLPYLYVLIIGVGFLFTFYDIFDINVSFIQTCVQIVPKCVPGGPPGSIVAADKLGLPVLWNLIGYVIGALILSPLADRFGRRDMLLVTMVITGLGSLATAFVQDYNTFIIARTITGIGIGADLAIVNTYINEVAPREGRAKYTSLIFVSSGLGAFVGIWLGLILTTPAGQFPAGLPFAQAQVQPLFGGPGWRIMYVVGAVLALVGVLLRVQLPESPRWLVSRGRLQEADAVVRRMEDRAGHSSQVPQAMDEVPVQSSASSSNPFVEILTTPQYLGRVVLLLLTWLTAYVTVYSIGAGFTSILTPMLIKLDPHKYTPPVAAPTAGMIAAIGTLGFIGCGVFAYYFGERLERKYWLPIGAALTLIGGAMIGLWGASNVVGAFIGAVVLFFGFNIWVPITYSWSTESFPTRARTTGFGIVDGIGHMGGGIGLLLITPLLTQISPLAAFLLIGAFLVVAAIIAQFGIATRGKRLDVVSP